MQASFHGTYTQSCTKPLVTCFLQFGHSNSMLGSTPETGGMGMTPPPAGGIGGTGMLSPIPLSVNDDGTGGPGGGGGACSLAIRCLYCACNSRLSFGVGFAAAAASNAACPSLCWAISFMMFSCAGHNAGNSSCAE